MISLSQVTVPSSTADGGRHHLRRWVLGWFYIPTGGVHLGIVAAGPGPALGVLTFLAAKDCPRMSRRGGS